MENNEIVVHKKKGFTNIMNETIQDKRLSLKACGLLMRMLSLPADWDFSINGLAVICKEGVKSIRSGLKELETYGYLVRIQYKDIQGHFRYKYFVFEDPADSAPYTQNGNAAPYDHFVHAEKDTQQNNNNKINNTSKKERKKPERKSYNDIIDSMIEDEELKAELIEYIKWRKMAKKTLTNHILEGLLQQLLSISSDPKKLVGIVRKSMFNGWAEFYPPAPPKVFTDNNQKPSTQIAKFNNFKQREGVEFDELEKALFFGKGRLDE